MPIVAVCSEQRLLTKNMPYCKKCGRAVTGDEMGLYMKLVNRGATSYLCIDCLADFFGCEKELLERKIEHFRNIGCTLF